MAPKVEAPEKNGGPSTHFSVDLNSPDQFDSTLFDELAKKAGSVIVETSMLKYIVVGGRMWVFSHDESHRDVMEDLEINGQEGQLQSAGMVTVAYFISFQLPYKTQLCQEEEYIIIPCRLIKIVNY